MAIEPTDLVKRLRKKAHSWANKFFSPFITHDQHITWEAAEEITRLTLALHQATCEHCAAVESGCCVNYRILQGELSQ